MIDINRIGFILNIIVLCNCTFACILSIIILIRINYYLFSKRMKQEMKISMIFLSM
jgi:hypothetical protein